MMPRSRGDSTKSEIMARDRMDIPGGEEGAGRYEQRQELETARRNKATDGGRRGHEDRSRRLMWQRWPRRNFQSVLPACGFNRDTMV